ncbi:hypothetical protein BGZ51_000509 [Haplosporangium sp. Z 767]|nr:hypothetical protein BGZ51_000509 [Haplosporangium sp. Z 767]
MEAASSEAMRSDLKALRVASIREGEEGQDHLWEIFKAKYSEDPMMAYLDKNWLTDEERPNWHKSLKKHYLRNERNVRPDYLMYILITEIDLDSHATYFMIKNGLEAPKMSKADKRRKKRADGQK